MNEKHGRWHLGPPVWRINLGDIRLAGLRKDGTRGAEQGCGEKNSKVLPLHESFFLEKSATSDKPLWR
jgi:hypothetical protein